MTSTTTGAQREEVPSLLVSELSERLRRRDITSVALTQAYLDRISRLDEHLRSYITVVRDVALQQARAADDLLSRGEAPSLITGIPYGIKDQFDTRGIRTTYGSAVFSEHIPVEDAAVVERLREAGAVLLGKQNMTELAIGGTQEYPYGRPRNPWDLRRTPGASSSGSAAAQAAGLCAFAIGEDTGGSVRGPAGRCGVTGLKPTWGRVSRYGMRAFSWTLDCAGIFARSAEDCALVLQSIAGPDPRDPWAYADPVPQFAGSLTGNIGGLRIGLVRELCDGDTAEEVRALVQAAVAELQGLGARVDEVSLPIFRQAASIYVGVAEAEASSLYRDLMREHLRHLDHNTQVRFLSAALVPAQLVSLAQRARAALRQQVDSALRRFDVLVGATSATAPEVVGGSPAALDEDGVYRRVTTGRAYTQPFNLHGGPAVSAPCGFTREGLPVGVQVAGQRFHESTVLNVVHAYQKVTNWHLRRPAVS